jgi:transcription-repair coupling factor (superfamily II helicase)
LKNKEALEKMVEDCAIETDFEALIPESYISNISERLGIYTQLDDIKDKNELDNFIKMLKDRFGPIPKGVHNLIEIVKLRWKAIAIGFEKVTIKNARFRGYIPENKPPEFFQSANFGNLLNFIKDNPKDCRMKELKGKLLITIENISSAEAAIQALEHVLEPVTA